MKGSLWKVIKNDRHLKKDRIAETWMCPSRWKHHFKETNLWQSRDIFTCFRMYASQTSINSLFVLKCYLIMSDLLSFVSNVQVSLLRLISISVLIFYAVYNNSFTFWNRLILWFHLIIRRPIKDSVGEKNC